MDINEEQLHQKMESWLSDKLNGGEAAAAADVSTFINYIVSALGEEESSDEEKAEAIRPILQELIQSSQVDEEQLLTDLISYWNEIKSEAQQENESAPGDESTKSGDRSADGGGPDASNTPTDTILMMINKHKTQVEVRKPVTERPAGSECVSHLGDESDSEDESGATKTRTDDALFANTNLQEAQTRDKLNRDKMAETHAKQKEQSKQALIEQRQREVDKKKKAQQKAAKVERKR